MARSALALLFLAIASAPASAIEFKDIQASYGQLGPERKVLEFVPGDEVYFRYALVGVTADAKGKLNAEMNIKLIDAKEKVLLDQSFPMEGNLAFGGNTLPSYANLLLSDKFLPGDYTMIVTVLDNVSKEMNSFKRQFRVKERELAITAIRFFHDKIGRVPAPCGGLISQTLFMKFCTVGFEVKEHEIDLKMEVHILDAEGKPTMPKPITVNFHSEDPEKSKLGIAAFDVELVLNRPGDFKMKILVKDMIGGKSTTFEVPLKVIERLP